LIVNKESKIDFISGLYDVNIALKQLIARDKGMCSSYIGGVATSLASSLIF